MYVGAHSLLYIIKLVTLSFDKRQMLRTSSSIVYSLQKLESFWSYTSLLPKKL
jgi:hypothetical protein